MRDSAEIAGVLKILVQMRGTSLSVFPPTIGQLPLGGRTKPEHMQMQGNGIKVLPETDNCDVSDLPKFLLDNGFDLVFVKVEKRQDRDNEKAYFLVSFTFSKEVNPTISQDIEILYEEFCQLCEESFWRIRIFNNPIWQENRGFAVNLDCRKPRACPNGTLVTMCEKDGRGEKIKGTGKPISPEYELKIAGGCFVTKTVSRSAYLAMKARVS